MAPMIDEVSSPCTRSCACRRAMCDICAKSLQQAASARFNHNHSAGIANLDSAVVPGLLSRRFPSVVPYQVVPTLHGPTRQNGRDPVHIEELFLVGRAI